MDKKTFRGQSQKLLPFATLLALPAKDAPPAEAIDSLIRLAAEQSREALACWRALGASQRESFCGAVGCESTAEFLARLTVAPPMALAAIVNYCRAGVVASEVRRVPTSAAARGDSHASALPYPLSP
jgi:hypothetical protein